MIRCDLLKRILILNVESSIWSGMCFGALNRSTRSACPRLFVFTAIICLFVVGSGRAQDAARFPPDIADDLDPESLRRAITQSLVYLSKLPPDRLVGSAPRPVTAKEVQESLIAFDRTLDDWSCTECWRKRIAQNFEFLPSAEDQDVQNVLFTGYYDPIIDASFSPSAEDRYPIYGKPADLVVDRIAVF